MRGISNPYIFNVHLNMLSMKPISSLQLFVKILGFPSFLISGAAACIAKKNDERGSEEGLALIDGTFWRRGLPSACSGGCRAGSSGGPTGLVRASRTRAQYPSPSSGSGPVRYHRANIRKDRWFGLASSFKLPRDNYNPARFRSSRRQVRCFFSP
jgi:hypothetical protein